MHLDVATTGKERENHANLLRLEVERLTLELRRLGASKILLFGSMARGRLDLFTDIDLLVVMHSNLPFVERCGWVYQKLMPRVDADIIVYTEQEFESLKDSPFLKKALAEGVVLYEANPA
ncbi:nucleotidyltransferase domain-containing protein [Syntrophothermus lipocalidus]|uniref:DNA polymerase beta domain protein region n=1 Tax=Syntrophothermus lipocalidus (strain DSM 12680 / TGB-C1) TaxID=643648 RepID=D7CPV1_SYNLT|nr:nucleotidyltransferase domain-containing protein [Syntrophothermus lipocalidus]ADI02729.1 DNA polymerase beta domain protein region [Syntrophothermus lipocalidus DSM 12680]